MLVEDGEGMDEIEGFKSHETDKTKSLTDGNYFKVNSWENYQKGNNETARNSTKAWEEKNIYTNQKKNNSIEEITTKLNSFLDKQKENSVAIHIISDEENEIENELNSAEETGTVTGEDSESLKTNQANSETEQSSIVKTSAADNVETDKGSQVQDSNISSDLILPAGSVGHSAQIIDFTKTGSRFNSEPFASSKLNPSAMLVYGEILKKILKVYLLCF